MAENTSLYAKMARIMGNLNRMPKSGTNEHFKYKFVSDSDVADAIRAELSHENIAFFASMTGVEQNDGHTVASFEFTFVCGDTGEVVTSSWFGEANDKQDKGISKASTSAEKYFLLKTFLISTGDPVDDPDTDGRGDKSPQTRKTTSKSSAKPSAQSVVHDMPSDDELRAAGAWASDTEKVNAFIGFMGEYWQIKGLHLGNRIRKALGYTGPGLKSWDEFYIWISDNAAESANNMTQRCKLYVSDEEA